MRDEDVLDLLLLLEREGAGDPPGIERDRVVDEERGHPMAGNVPAIAAQDLELHSDRVWTRICAKSLNANCLEGTNPARKLSCRLRSVKCQNRRTRATTQRLVSARACHPTGSTFPLTR